jgi:hypothetical protein
MRNGLITVTKLSYGYDDVDCVVVIVCMFLLLCTEWGGGAVDPESTPIVDPAPPPVLLTFSS